jgi:hypothetical protein
MHQGADFGLSQLKDEVFGGTKTVLFLQDRNTITLYYIVL